MAAPAWFDEIYYGQQKVIQMNALAYEPEWLAAHGASEWDFTLYNQYLAAYRLPDGSPVSAWDNFLACNGRNYSADIDPAQLNISCNALFDPDWYCQSLVDWANATDYVGAEAARVSPGQWTMSAMAEHVLKGLGMSMWEHFKTLGLREQLNPSAAFDTHAYLEARAEAMSTPGHRASIDDAIAALLSAGENPVMDYEVYGREHGIAPVPVAIAPVAPAPAPTAPADDSNAPAAPAQPDASQPDPAKPENPAAPGTDPETPENPGTDPEDPEDPENPGTDPEDPENPGTEPEDPENPETPWHVVIEQAGNVTVPAMASQGEDIDVYVDATGMVTVPSLNALGPGGLAGSVSLTIPNGHLGSGSATTVIKGQDITVDLGGGSMPVEGDLHAFPRLQLWAEGTIDMMGSNQSDWVSIRDIGSGRTEINLDDEEDILELFDLSATCTPATLPRDADIHINLGDCWDQLYIGDLAVQGGIQTIHVDLGNDMRYETISLGRVTAGKLVLSLEHPNVYDEITTRGKIAPQSFHDGEEACSALKAFGIDAYSAELGIWHDRVRNNGLVEKAYSDAAIYANDNTYVIYGNVLLELVGIGEENFADA